MSTFDCQICLEPIISNKILDHFSCQPIISKMLVTFCLQLSVMTTFQIESHAKITSKGFFFFFFFLMINFWLVLVSI